MKFILDIAGQRVALSATQLEALADVLTAADMVITKYVGKQTQGANADGYVTHVVPFDVSEYMSVKCAHDDYIDALKLATKLASEKK